MTVTTTLLLALAATSVAATALPNRNLQDDKYMHAHARSKRATHKVREGEDTAQYWNDLAQATLRDKLEQRNNKGVAKNVILFLGDGMSLSTQMAARVWMAQKEGKENGEENYLSFEKFPYTGLSKTYCVDKQVADSACSGTAYLSGVKANDGTLGVTAAVPPGECRPALNQSNWVYSIGRWSQLAGKKTGIVTTTKVTHASPASVYAHSAHRDWEADSEISAEQKGCDDIAKQLVYGDTGRNLNVVLGGGRCKFYTSNEMDPEGAIGNRQDRNLVNEWLSLKSNHNARYVWNRSELLNVQTGTEYLLGLFEDEHCQYEMDRNKETDPSLTEMTETAIRLLSKSPEGYFLFVEGGRIDHAHHDSLAKKALDETLQFSEAVRKAVSLTSPVDTLIVVTADHAHTMTVSGYAERGNDILGLVAEGDDHLMYSTLSYANGPGYKMLENGSRQNLLEEDMKDNHYAFPSAVPLAQETHGGEDVGIYALGPWAHLFVGNIEQNTIPHVMAFASCVGDGLTICKKNQKTKRP